MKSIKFFFACVLALTFVACSNAESDSFEDNSSNFESMISLYGIQSATVDSKVGDVPSVTAEEMASVLEALRQNGNTIRNCESETLEGYYEGAFVEQFALCVSINFNIDNNGGVFYIGTTYSSSTDLFNWQGYGASLSTTAEGNSVFSSTSYLYFRVSDQGNCLVKVPVSFKGSYNFKDNKGTYSFTLSKAAN